MVIPFGRHRGKDLKDLPQDYLVWMQDRDANPNGITRNGVNWSALASQELSRRQQERQNVIQEAPAIFSYLPPSTYTGDVVKKLTPELVKAIREGAQIELEEKTIMRLMQRVGYTPSAARWCAGLIIWAARAALAGKRPAGYSNDMEVWLYNYMDEKGNFCDEQQSNNQAYW